MTRAGEQGRRGTATSTQKGHGMESQQPQQARENSRVQNPKHVLKDLLLFHTYSGKKLFSNWGSQERVLFPLRLLRRQDVSLGLLKAILVTTK